MAEKIILRKNWLDSVIFKKRFQSWNSKFCIIRKLIWLWNLSIIFYKEKLSFVRLKENWRISSKKN